jgi:AcrR family transcriptional regulator
MYGTYDGCKNLLELFPHPIASNVERGLSWRMEHATKGRPRSFDEDKAIDAAMRVFWEKTFEGTSMTDLTDATRLSRSSIHAAFGSKEGLFLKAVERYKSGQMMYIQKALAEPTLPRAIEALFRGMLYFLSIPGNPKGCLSIHGALACGTEGELVTQVMAKWYRSNENRLKERIQKAQREGELGRDVNAADYARYIATIMIGIGIQAVNGASRAELTRTVEMALQFLSYSSFDPAASGDNSGE